MGAMGNFSPYYPQRGIVMTLNGNYQAKVNLPEAKFDTDWADSCVYLPQEGVEVLVIFINGDLNRPVITNRLPTDNEVGNASVELGGGGQGVAYVGCTVQVDLQTGQGTITSGSNKVTTG
ncbi:hypothetical protein [Alicyclobacillus fastidiosus]|uniref:Uncharacterized protein n=2 Tax=Alicyclobacillus fastidiosus TaxID=392011 RepID=A0ABV5AKK8_9BACL|nr:hypothetical protein [Alicyclobacillus fastidiosus]WAH43561.1 hypothetical protein NZD89_09345 [Alicyclobacillus fastidiosus]WEH08179.1 hypothetical protein PYS47_15850 [Alicyclobacillus fastidiosus]GMA59739.1 hypothetical protein GCM10025859_01790 [Alicyclobacillus fastidiosus]